MTRADLQLAVSEAKVSEYLLNISHPDGGSKARFFVKRGFDPQNPANLVTALFLHAQAYWPGRQIPVGPLETKFVIDGPFRAMDGSFPDLRSVWQGPTGGNSARLITAYPL